MLTENEKEGTISNSFSGTVPIWMPEPEQKQEQ